MMMDDEIEDDNLEEGSVNDSDSSVSDFDEDEDPDKIEVPGGGRDLATAMNFRQQTTATAGPSSSSGSTSSAVHNQPSSQKIASTLNNIKNSYLNGNPLPLSSLGIPILPVNTATTKIGGTVKRGAGGNNGQPGGYQSK